MMTANAQAFALSLGFLASLAWITIVMGFALVALMRKLIAWISAWM